MFYSKIKYFSSVNGPGFRTALFVSGCSIRCHGCFNQDAWSFTSGAELSESKIDEIIESIDHEWNSGLSILGGEPLEPKNQYDVCKLLWRFRDRFGQTKTVWLWTGYTFGENIPKTEWTDSILWNTDVLVDGPFLSELRDDRLSFRGSSNQRVIWYPWWVKSNSN